MYLPFSSFGMTLGSASSHSTQIITEPDAAASKQNTFWLFLKETQEFCQFTKITQVGQIRKLWHGNILNESPAAHCSSFQNLRPLFFLPPTCHQLQVTRTYYVTKGTRVTDPGSTAELISAVGQHHINSHLVRFITGITGSVVLLIHKVYLFVFFILRSNVFILFKKNTKNTFLKKCSKYVDI